MKELTKNELVQVKGGIAPGENGTTCTNPNPDDYGINSPGGCIPPVFPPILTTL